MLYLIIIINIISSKFPIVTNNCGATLAAGLTTIFEVVIVTEFPALSFLNDLAIL